MHTTNGLLLFKHKHRALYTAQNHTGTLSVVCLFDSSFAISLTFPYQLWFWIYRTHDEKKPSITNAMTHIYEYGLWVRKISQWLNHNTQHRSCIDLFLTTYPIWRQKQDQTWLKVMIRIFTFVHSLIVGIHWTVTPYRHKYEHKRTHAHGTHIIIDNKCLLHWSYTIGHVQRYQFAIDCENSLPSCDWPFIKR